MNRREFLVRGGLACIGLAGARPLMDVLGPRWARTGTAPVPAGSVLAGSASDCPIDTIVVVMMENRSFDHSLGWLGHDDVYLDAGRRRYGASFFVDGLVDQWFPDALGQPVATHPAEATDPEKVETRGCSFKDPGHTWTTGACSGTAASSRRAVGTTSSR
jgi:phospholipase C